ncbi:hypothetical protein ACFWA9_04610 [Kitasatospora sp. NPDC059973]|uniref:hypothetical protein n=1 Tax=Kitasatospora sp. NPDC059973 TaxID=3347020 RepID=UPI003690C06A
MIVSISGVVLAGCAVFFVVRSRRATVGAAIVAVVFGFLLASTGLAKPIQSALDGTAQVTGSVKP